MAAALQRQPSFKSRAIAHLARRDYSRAELGAKLLREVRAQTRAAVLRASADLADAPHSVVDECVESQAQRGSSGFHAEDITATIEAEIEATLDAMEALGYLSEARVVESVVNRKAAIQGAARIRQALRGLGVSEDASASALSELKATESARAAAVWARKFGSPPQDIKERAKQMRFLAARGFAESAIRAAVPKVSVGLDQRER